MEMQVRYERLRERHLVIIILIMTKTLSHNDFFYFCIPLDNIPFDKLPIKISERYAYCRFYHVSSVINEPAEFNLVGVYDFLSNEPLKTIKELLTNDFLFGEVISFDPPLRGKGSWKIIEQHPINITKEDLPHLKFGNKEGGFYLKDGKYYLFAGIKSKFENIKHLEDCFFYGDNSIKLRIIIELIKRKAKELNQHISLEEWKEIASLVFGSTYSKKPVRSDIINDAVQNLLPGMLEMPIYTEIPKEIRGKVLDEV